MNYGMDYQGDTGGFGGGGFGGGGFSGEGSQAYGGGGGTPGGGGGRRSYDEQTVIPCTIRMVLSAQSDEGNLKLEDGRSPYHVRIVGAIRSCEDSSTNVVYNVEDGTGLIDVKQWLDDGDCAALGELRQQTLKDNIYVKVVGQIKDYEGRKMIVASSVRPLSTGNEITHHLLDVVYSSENYQRKDKIVAPATPMLMGNAGVGFGSRTPVAQISTTQGVSNPLKQEVIKYIKVEGDRSEVGVNIHNCVQLIAARGQYSEEDVRRTIGELSAEGHIYSTVNEDNYKFAM